MKTKNNLYFLIICLIKKENLNIEIKEIIRLLAILSQNQFQFEASSSLWYPLFKNYYIRTCLHSAPDGTNPYF